MNAEEIAKKHCAQKNIACSLSQTDCMAEAILVAIKTLKEIAEDDSKDFTDAIDAAILALAKIRGEK